jgi:Flp pilus assembly protein TadG
VVTLVRRSRGRSGDGRAREGGALSLELVLLAPFLISIGMLILAFGRYVGTEAALDQASKDAARSATAARSAGEAQTAVNRVIDADLDGTPRSCIGSATHTVVSSSGTFQASDPYDPDKLVTLTVTVTCRVDTSDLAFIGLGSFKVTSTFSSPMPAEYGIYDQGSL